MGEERSVRFVALLLAAGSGSRLGGKTPKPYLELRGRTVLEWSARRLARVPGHVATILAVDAESHSTRIPELSAALSEAKVVRIVEGGATRQASCASAWQAAAGFELDCVAVHDCARPFFSIEASARAIEVAAKSRAGAILGSRARDTLKRVDDDGRVLETLERSSAFHAATPQVFAKEAWLRMLAFAEAQSIDGTDEAALAEACGIDVAAIDSPSTNIKITYAEDLLLLPALEALLDDPSEPPE